MKELRSNYNILSDLNKALKFASEKILEAGAALDSPEICSLVYDSTGPEVNSRALRIAAERGSHKALDYLFKTAMHSHWDFDTHRAHLLAGGADYDKVQALANSGSDSVVTRLVSAFEEHNNNRLTEIWGPSRMSRPRLSVPEGLVRRDM